ncbi:unnamed protein product [Caenorhabditis auriculariae]|uniref:Uncharacterized protein n=1 Tax=Caenorhabditis auriculariae TaxID=2777116 RepID=A0A8S1GNB7_9PELO|nr:unnamed protein product [Caenorhabditis auriculariae]
MGMTDFPVDFAATQANEESRTIPTNDDDFDARSNVSEERAGTKPSEQIHSLDASLCDEMSNRSGLGNTSLHFPLSPLAVIPIEHKDLLPQLNEQMQILVNYINFLEERYERLSKDLDHEMMTFASTLDEERFKITKLEEMLNDTIDLHQAEFESIKSQNDIAERIDYQHDKRIQNLEEKIESLQNHIIRLEETLNSLVEVRASKAPIWGSAALSGANILVEILKIVLFIVAATLDMLRPLTGSRNRAGFVIVALVLLFFFGHHITKYNPFSLFFWARNAVKNSTDKKT